MIELPLFPLHTVLFPGTPLGLHVFEDRYKQLVGDCIEVGSEFGVALIRKGVEALGPLPEPFRIGCRARIMNVERQADGEMVLLAVGTERFRILSIDHHARPYLTARAEGFPLVKTGLPLQGHYFRKIHDLTRRYLDLLAESGKSNFELEALPEEPVSLAYTAAAMLPVPLIQKQLLLSIGEEEGLLGEVYAVLRREIALLRTILKEEEAVSGPFSQN